MSNAGSKDQRQLEIQKQWDEFRKLFESLNKAYCDYMDLVINDAVINLKEQGVDNINMGEVSSELLRHMWDHGWFENVVKRYDLTLVEMNSDAITETVQHLIDRLMIQSQSNAKGNLTTL